MPMKTWRERKLEEMTGTEEKQKKNNGSCQTKTEVYSRVVGFYRPVEQWNKGKREEFGIRKTYAV